MDKYHIVYKGLILTRTPASKKDCETILSKHRFATLEGSRLVRITKRSKPLSTLNQRRAAYWGSKLGYSPKIWKRREASQTAQRFGLEGLNLQNTRDKRYIWEVYS